MRLFVPNLPESVTESELRRLVRRQVRSPWLRLWRRSGSITALEIVQFTNPDPRSVEYHGIIEIEPELPALRAIRKLNGSRIKGKAIEVRMYHRRSSYRERRIQQIESQGGVMFNRRKGERRRLHLQREIVEVSGRCQTDIPKPRLVAVETEQGVS